MQSSVVRAGEQHTCLWLMGIWKELGFLDLADLSLCPRGISERCGFPVCWPFACL